MGLNKIKYDFKYQRMIYVIFTIIILILNTYTLNTPNINEILNILTIKQGLSLPLILVTCSYSQYITL